MTSLRARSWVMVAALACAEAACLGGDQRHESAGIKIGALLPYTGELAASGPALEQGMTMAAETVNRAGGVAGQTLVLDIEDTHSSLERGVASAERLFARGVVGLVGPEEVVLASELAPTLNSHQSLMISGGISARAEPGKEPSLWLRIYPSAKTVTARLASRMIADGITETSLLHVSDGYGSTFATFFSLKYIALGGKIRDSVTLPDDGSAVAFPKGLPDSLVLLAYPRAGALTVQQVAAAGFRGRWYLGPTLESEEFLLNTPPGVLDGMVGISPALSADSSEFADQFRQRFGQDPSLGANFYFDSVAVLALALQSAYVKLQRRPTVQELAAHVRSVSGPPGETITWSELHEGLEALGQGRLVNYRGLSGPIDFDNDGDVAQGLVRFWQVHGGQVVRE